MSPRNFARVFLKDTGTTPARFVECLRVEAARRRLEESRDKKLEKIANDMALNRFRVCADRFFVFCMLSRTTTGTTSQT